jgi:hypothetical protein
MCKPDRAAILVTMRVALEVIAAQMVAQLRRARRGQQGNR